MCGFHTTPICQLHREETPPTFRGVNRKKWRWRVGFTPPLAPFKKKRKGGSLKLPLPSMLVNSLKWSGRWVSHCSVVNAAGEKSPPQMPGGITEHKQDGTWFSCCLIGFWYEKQGRRGLEQPPPSPTISPASSSPSFASLLLFPTFLAPSCSHLLFLAPTSLKEGRGWLLQLVGGCHQQ